MCKRAFTNRNIVDKLGILGASETVSSSPAIFDRVNHLPPASFHCAEQLTRQCTISLHGHPLKNPIHGMAISNKVGKFAHILLPEDDHDSGTNRIRLQHFLIFVNISSESRPSETSAENKKARTAVPQLQFASRSRISASTLYMMSKRQCDRKSGGQRNSCAVAGFSYW